jgi:acyl-CoA oxidase
VPSSPIRSLRSIPDDADDLLPLLPLIYVAWSDGILDPTELQAIRERMIEVGELSPKARTALEGWLNPDDPPGGEEISRLRERIRDEAARIPRGERRSLARLGVAMARLRPNGPDRWGTAEGLRTLEGLEELLGVLGDEAARELLQHPPGAERDPESEEELADPRPLLPSPPFSVPDMTHRLEAASAKIRERVLTLLLEPELRIPQGLPAAEYRERVLVAVQRLAEEGLGLAGLPEEYGGEGNIPASILAFEMLAYGDLSVLVKFGVQFGLFGGSILQLGTARHHEPYLAAVGRADLLGCYAMTERNHGSNVREVETLARYLPDSGEFEIHTPHPGARKDWLGNAAAHGRMATVFAQLEVEEEEHGVHALLVPIRDDDGTPLPGVRSRTAGTRSAFRGWTTAGSPSTASGSPGRIS